MTNRKIMMTDEDKEVSRQFVLKAVRMLGGQHRVARLLRLSQPTIGGWCKGLRPLPIWRAIQLEQLLVGEITIGDLRPDLRRCGIEKIHQESLT